MSVGIGGPVGSWPVVVPGDPVALRQASHAYARAAVAMAHAAQELRGELASVASWRGAGAGAHAVRVEALAAAHQLGAQALNFGATALATYAVGLEAAQDLAARANLAGELADQLNVQVGQATAVAAEADRAVG